jgi:hypothetical protein
MEDLRKKGFKYYHKRPSFFSALFHIRLWFLERGLRRALELKGHQLRKASEELKEPSVLIVRAYEG